VNVLFVCHRLPYPPRRGGKIRPFNVIRHLTDSGHRVTVASLARSAAEAEEGKDLAKHCAATLIETVSTPAAGLRMLARLPTPVPSSFGYFYSAALRRRVEQALARESFDLIMVHCSSVAGYVAGVTGIPKILDFGDMDSQKWLLYAQHRGLPLAAGFWLEGRKLEREERRLAAKFDLSTCTTRAELATLESYAAAPATGWYPNGVDASYFSPTTAAYDPDTICFVGRMDYFPNQQAVLWFCREVLPAIRAQRSTAKLAVVGAAPSAAIRALGSLPGVTVTGTVKDVRPLVQAAALTIAPLIIARGTQNKILESMAMGVPVVASTTAAGGVDAEPGVHLHVAGTAQAFAAAVLRVLQNPRERARLAEAGRQRVLTNHAWPASLARLDTLVARCLAGYRAGVPRAESVRV
jgi:sugar transferase (PEP-CTERM/EpsH1 system associated)